MSTQPEATARTYLQERLTNTRVMLNSAKHQEKAIRVVLNVLSEELRRYTETIPNANSLFLNAAPNNKEDAMKELRVLIDQVKSDRKDSAMMCDALVALQTTREQLQEMKYVLEGKLLAGSQTSNNMTGKLTTAFDMQQIKYRRSPCKQGTTEDYGILNHGLLLGYPQPEKQGFRTDKTGRPLHWQHTRERAYNAEVIIKSLGQQECCIRGCISALTEELTTLEVDADDVYARLRIESDIKTSDKAVGKWKDMVDQLAAYRKELRSLHEELLAVETEREYLESRYGIVIPV